MFNAKKYPIYRQLQELVYNLVSVCFEDRVLLIIERIAPWIAAELFMCPLITGCKYSQYIVTC